MRLVFMGKLGAVVHDDFAEIAVPDSVLTLADLKEWLGQKMPPLARMMQATPIRVVVNHAVVHDLSRPVCQHDEVAFLPPMSGG